MSDVVDGPEAKANDVTRIRAIDADPNSQTATASFQVLGNYELLRAILLSIKLWDKGSNGSKTTVWKREFVSLLRVNRNFFQNAAEIVWETMHSMLPLFRLLPSFQERDSGYDFRSVESSNWYRFSLYAGWIKTFDFDHECPLQALPERWLLMLLARSAKDPLVPMLRSAYVSNKARGIARLLPLIMSESLQELSLSLRSPRAHLAPPDDWKGRNEDTLAQASALIASMGHLAPNLDTLSYLGPISRELVELFSAQRALAKLSLTATHNFDVEALEQISKIRTLQTIELSLLEVIVQPDQRPTTPPPNLSLLRRLWVSADSMSLHLTMAHIRPTHLRHFEAQITRRSSNRLDFTLTKILDGNPNLETFKVCTPSGDLSFVGGEFPDQLPMRLLTSLCLSVHEGNLSEVTITSVPLFTGSVVGQVRERLLKRHSRSSLKIFRFHIPSAFNTSNEANWHATPSTLSDLTFHGCKTLEHLELHFSNSSFSPPVAAPCKPALSMREKLAAASFIDACFPELEHISGTASEDWSDVWSIMQTFAANRELFEDPGPVWAKDDSPLVVSQDDYTKAIIQGVRMGGLNVSRVYKDRLLALCVNHSPLGDLGHASFSTSLKKSSLAANSNGMDASHQSEDSSCDITDHLVEGDELVGAHASGLLETGPPESVSESTLVAIIAANPDVGEPSASSQVLHDRDLLRAILLSLKVWGDRQDVAKTTWKRDFLSLLSVNQDLFHTTAELMWETMHSMLPLFLLLPSFQSDTGQCSFRGLKHNEWDRFDLYAKWIKKFKFLDECPLQTLPERWLLMLLARSAKDPLMPMLRSVHITSGARGLSRLLPLTMSGSLQELTLATRSSREEATLAPPDDWKGCDDDALAQVSALMASMGHLAPNLNTLSYIGPISQELGELFSAQRALTSLSLTITHDFGLEVLAHIGRMQTLQTLKLELTGQVHKLSRINRSPNLHLLAQIWVTSDFLTLHDTFKYIRPTHLRHFKAQITRRSSNRIDHTLRSILDKNRTLETFQVCVPGRGVEFVGGEFPERLHRRQMRTVVSLCNSVYAGVLSEVTITGVPLFTGSVVGDVRARMLRHHSRSSLKTFRFYIPSVFNTSNDVDWHATPSTLSNLAFHGCQTLEHLELHFSDASFSLPAVVPNKVSLHGLKTLGIITDATKPPLSIQEKLAAASFIDACFPKLERVWGTAFEDWKDVWLIIQTLGANRKLHASSVEDPVDGSIDVGDDEH